jgi:type VI protein secretion system component VasA
MIRQPISIYQEIRENFKAMIEARNSLRFWQWRQKRELSESITAISRVMADHAKRILDSDTPTPTK